MLPARRTGTLGWRSASVKRPHSLKRLVSTFSPVRRFLASRKARQDSQRRRGRLPLLLEDLEQRFAPAFLGADSFGYIASDREAFAFEDIGATGTALGLADNTH